MKLIVGKPSLDNRGIPITDTEGNHLIWVVIPYGGLEQAKELANKVGAAPDLIEALKESWSVINAAGIENLTNGVQLGALSWMMKAKDAQDLSNAAIAKAEGK